MRVDVCLTEFPVLSETFVLDQITALIDRGHDVRIVALRLGDTALVHADVRRYALLERVDLWGDAYAHMPRGKLRRLARALAHLARAAPEERRVLLRALDPRAHGRDALTLNLLFRARRALARGRTRRTDVMLCHFAQIGERFVRLGEIGATRAPVATVYHGHDLARHLPIDPAKPPYPALFRSGALHLPVSEHWRRVLLEAGVAPERVAVHHMGIAIDAAAPDGADGRPLRVLTVCRLVEKKGVRYAVEAFRAFARDHPGARYRIIGDGPLRAEIAALIASTSTGEDEAIRLDGPVDADGVRAALAASDVFLLPSVTAADGDQEGIPVVLMEAMAAGRVVVSSRHSGIPELVEDGVSGLLADERDVEGLDAALRAIQSDPALRRRLGRAAREAVAAGFDAERLNERLVEHLETICRPARRPERGPDRR